MLEFLSFLIMFAIITAIFCLLCICYILTTYLSHNRYKVIAISYEPETKISGKRIMRWCNCFTKFMANRIANQYIHEIKGIKYVEIMFQGKTIYEWGKNEG